MSVVAFPSYKTKHTFHYLCNITLVGCQEVRVVFEIESPSNGDELLTSQQPLPLLPYLKNVHLERMETMTHVWKCNNWDEFFILHKDQPKSSFQNLTTINLYDCNKIKYLFSPLMLKLFSGLKDAKIISCKSVEEVVSERDDKYEEIMTTFSPHLDVRQLYDLDNLERIGGGVAKGTTNFSHDESKVSQVDVVSWSLCQYATEIRISTCPTLSSVIPSYAGGQMQKLEKLSILNCSSMTEIFENIEIDNNNISGCSSSSTGAIPRPTNSTNSLPNLRVLMVEGCDRLENIFTLSTFQSLKKLEVLIIRDCKAMKVIVTQECEEHASEDVEVSFLKSIVLAGLPNLVGFFTGMDVHFQWPVLEYVMINDCPQMTEFPSSNSTAPNLKFIHTEPGKDDLEYGLNFGAKFMRGIRYVFFFLYCIKYTRNATSSIHPMCSLVFGFCRHQAQVLTLELWVCLL
ncbi:uncharacterized protein LOC143624392 [Bidens hawaiensis]|uniref:uncharacterized protein LOC143624392 n=1 Tax=Bidens hawaiensis TaxID=980011 RepID=UPI00404B90C1